MWAGRIDTYFRIVNDCLTEDEFFFSRRGIGANVSKLRNCNLVSRSHLLGADLDFPRSRRTPQRWDRFVVEKGTIWRHYAANAARRYANLAAPPG